MKRSERSGFWGGLFAPDTTLEADKQQGLEFQPQIVDKYRVVSLWSTTWDANAWTAYLIKQFIALTPHPVALIADLGGTLAFGSLIKYGVAFGLSTIGFYTLIPLTVLIGLIAVIVIGCLGDNRTKLPVIFRLMTIVLGLAL